MGDLKQTQGDIYGFRFRKWQVYKDTMEFRKEINKLLKTFPAEEKYALVDQTKRALNSIVLNIAEGANKNTDKDTRLYINRAQTSLDEVVACLDCALSDGYLGVDEHHYALERASNLAKQLKGFAVHLSKKVND